MMDDDDDWQEMPVVREASTSYSSDEESSNVKRKKVTGRYKMTQSYNSQLSPPAKSFHNTTTNATGTHLDIDDARGYSWRAKPKGLGEAGGIGESPKIPKVKKTKKKKKGKELSSESSSSSETDEENDEGGARGYTQLRLDDDPEIEQISAASDYLFSGGGKQLGIDSEDAPNATPHSQLNTTKNLLSEGQKIAYVGLVSLVAKNLIRQLQRVPGKELQNAISSTEEWRLRVMARLFQHMEIESGEQNMIESLAQHGVLPADLSPSLITTQTVDNPDFDPDAEREREEEQEKEKSKEKMRLEEEAIQKLAEKERKNAAKRLDTKKEVMKGDIGDDEDSEERTEVGDGDLGDLGDISDVNVEAARRKMEKTLLDDRTEVDDGDLGNLSDPQSTSDNLKYASDTRTSLWKNHDGEDDGDISAALNSHKLQPLPNTDVSKGKANIIDSKIATQINLDQDTNVTPMGLTSAPQMIDTLPSALEGVTTELSSADKTITLDLRWTVLCDLFLVLTADSVYDARSRVLLEKVAEELGLHWMDVTKFEKRVTDALEIEEGVSGSLKGKKAVKKRAEAARRRRMVMMGLATVGGGLVIGLSAGLMAPLIGAGLGAALGTIGIGGTSGILGGVGSAAIITTTGTISGAALGGTGMNKRTRTVRTFEFKPIHNNKRVNCIVTVPGFMNGPSDDPRLPFSVIDSIMGDVFSVLWEPDMMQEMGNAINLLWNETLVQGVQQLLAATVAGSLVGALALPLWLTKLGYFIDNPWSNALDRAHSCGLILADVLCKRKLGVRPITLVGFSLGARVIFYALVELAKQKKYGVVQNVYLMGAPVTANDKTWKEARGIVAGRFVNAFSRTDWILGYLFRATSGGMRSIAGLHPVERVPEVENVDVTQIVPGHLQYRAYVPLVLDELGFRTTADYFDEPEDLNTIPERELRYDEQYKEARPEGFAKLWQKRKEQGFTTNNTPNLPSKNNVDYDHDDDLPPRQEAAPPYQEVSAPQQDVPTTVQEMDEMAKMIAELRENGIEVKELESSLPPLPLTPTSTTSSHFRGPSAKSSLAPALELPTPARSKIPTAHQTSSASSIVSSRRGSSVHSGDESFDSQGSNTLNARVPYARKFSSTIFDADELPPPAAAAASSDQETVSLSFAESYEEEEEEDIVQEEHKARARKSIDSELKSQVNDDDHDSLQQSAKQYGLSDETARELAKQFQSSGMSSQGASAAAKLAQNFSEMEQALPNQRLSLEIDPWGVPSSTSSSSIPKPPSLAMPPEPPQTFSSGRLRAEEDVDAPTPNSADIKTPTVAGGSGGGGGHWSENPWD